VDSLFVVRSFVRAGDRITKSQSGGAGCAESFPAQFCCSFAVVSNSLTGREQGWQSSASHIPTATPIRYLVVLWDENISFDHYFGTYPQAFNPQGEPPFVARPGTPAVNGLTSTLLQNNPNHPNPSPGDSTPAAPFRLDRSEALTCDNDNHYTDEQNAYDGGLLNKFAETLSGTGEDPTGQPCTPNLSMGYYDGNTVTAIWNYAQHYAMSDNYFGSTFGTTVMGHLNLIAGTTHGATPSSVKGTVINGSVIKNIDPLTTLDDCATTGTTNIEISGTNIGNLLNAKSVTWGWFYGDWIPTGYSGGVAQCVAEYDSHYPPFSISPRQQIPIICPPLRSLPSAKPIRRITNTA
jgi:phospholipase C